MRRLAGLITLAAGCTSSGTAASVSGDMPGGSFELADTISASITTSDGTGGSSSNARIVMTSTPSSCGDASATPPIDRKLGRSITIVLRDVAGAMTTTPAAPGTYTIYPDSGTEPPKSASLLTAGLDDACEPLDEDAATAKSGTVALTSITAGVFAGSFDVVLNTGGHITGSFDPAACPQLQAAVSTETHACR